MSKELVLFIDLDGTLKSEHDDNGPYDVPSLTVQFGSTTHLFNKKSPSLTVENGSKTHIFAQRPHLHEFLDFAKKYARIFLCTASGGVYARRVLKLMNVEDYFEKIIAAEDYAAGITFKSDWHCIFIDNSREMVDLKVQKLSEKQCLRSNLECKKDTWVIDTYHGSKDDTTLLDLIEELKKEINNG